MNNYMIDIKLPENPPQIFFDLIPSQREMVDKLMEEGLVLNYSLSNDRSKLWMLAKAEQESDVVNMLIQFPMIQFMDFTISLLAFHMSAPVEIPVFSMN